MISKLILVTMMSATVGTTPLSINKQYNESTPELQEVKEEQTLTGFKNIHEVLTSENSTSIRKIYRQIQYTNIETNLYTGTYALFNTVVNTFNKSTEVWTITDVTNIAILHIDKHINFETQNEFTEIDTRYYNNINGTSLIGSGSSSKVEYKNTVMDDWTINYYTADITNDSLMSLIINRQYSDLTALTSTANEINSVEQRENGQTGTYNPYNTIHYKENKLTANTYTAKAKTNTMYKFVNGEQDGTTSEENLSVNTNITYCKFESHTQWYKPTTTGNGNYNIEVIDIPSLMLHILSLPFTFISQAFNVTLFSGTPYAINFANIFKGLIALLTLLFIIKLFTKGLSALGDASGKDNNKKDDKGE